jgi:hypothetical protein
MVHNSTKNIYDLHATEATVVDFFGMIRNNYTEHQSQQQPHKKDRKAIREVFLKKCAEVQNIIFFLWHGNM